MLEGNITINELYDEIINNRKTIKLCIEASETKILLKLEDLKHRVDNLEKENLDLQNRIEELEKANRKNNLVIFGLNNIIHSEKITTETIISNLNELLGLNLLETDLNNIYTLGKSKQSPIKLELVSYLKKLEILRRCPKLKGTNISIVHDLTYQQRQDNKTLRKHLALAKQEKENKCFIKYNKLHLNGEVFTVEQLIHIENQDTPSQDRPSSAPATPNLRTDEPSTVNVPKPNIRGPEARTPTTVTTPKTPAQAKNQPSRQVTKQMRLRSVQTQK